MFGIQIKLCADDAFHYRKIHSLEPFKRTLTGDRNAWDKVLMMKLNPTKCE